MNKNSITNLWAFNTPDRFWCCQPDPPAEIWSQAIQQAFPLIGLENVRNLDELLHMTLGEAQFGQNRWTLDLVKQTYYELKPLLPRAVINFLKKIKAQGSSDNFPLSWPIEDRYVRFLWRVLEQVKILSDNPELTAQSFWPEAKNFAFVLTHDVESKHGQSNIPQVADFEETLGFRSSFNFVPDCYELDYELMKDLRQRGFEIGVHGLKHDGKLFHSKNEFMKRAQKINQYLKIFNAVGFRAPLTHRNPYWMQALDIEYDLSFFDTDPYEPMPGGCMSIWPFIIGRFVELPYTLVQDCTLGLVLGENTPKIWMDKVGFLEEYHGMALLNSHPDYLSQPDIWNMYVGFLMVMKEKTNYWHALPREVARWWQFRTNSKDGKKNDVP